MTKDQTATPGYHQYDYLMLVAVIYELFKGCEETDPIERRESRYLFTISVNLQPAF